MQESYPSAPSMLSNAAAARQLQQKPSARVDKQESRKDFQDKADKEAGSPMRQRELGLVEVFLQ